VQNNKHNFCWILLLNLMSKVPHMLWIIYVCFLLASCVNHVPIPNELATYRATCEAWSQRETTGLE
jgi:hypothetical protein